MNMNIDYIIKQFENFNEIEISNYTSDRHAITETTRYDRYIGNEKFKDSIEKWLNGFNDCVIFSNKDFSPAYSDLLMEYTYVTKTRYQKLLVNCLDELESRLQKQGIADLSDVFFVLLTSKNGITGGADGLSNELRELYAFSMVEKNHVISNYQDYFYNAYRKKENIFENASALVFMDDIFGSGVTVVGKVINFFMELEKYNNITGEAIELKNVYVISLVATSKGLNKVKQSLKNITDNCFSAMICENFFDKLNLNSKELMIQKDKHNKLGKELYDDRLENDNEKECLRGFNNTSILISFFYDTPNNTMPLFWRKTKHFLNPLFPRDPAHYNKQCFDFEHDDKAKKNTRKIIEQIDSMDKSNND